MTNTMYNFRKIAGNAIYIILLLLLWTIFAFNTDNPDYRIYSNWYLFTTHHGFITRFEPGFSAFMYLSAKSGLTYQQFLMVIGAIGLLLIGSSIKNHCKYPVVALALYGLYPFIFDVVQIRNFLSFSVILFGLKYLNEFTLKNALKYGICCLIAVLFHITAVFFVLFYIAYFKDYKHVLMVTTAITVAFIAIYLSSSSLVYKFLVNFGNEVYLEDGGTLAKVIGYGAFAILAVILMYVCHFKDNPIYENIYKNQEYLCKLIPLLLITCFAIAMTTQAYRFFRNMSLIVYIVFLNDGVDLVNRRYLKGRPVNFVNGIFAIAFSVFFYIRQISPWSPMYDRMTRIIIEGNILFLK